MLASLESIEYSATQRNAEASDAVFWVLDASKCYMYGDYMPPCWDLICIQPPSHPALYSEVPSWMVLPLVLPLRILGTVLRQRIGISCTCASARLPWMRFRWLHPELAEELAFLRKLRRLKLKAGLRIRCRFRQAQLAAVGGQCCSQQNGPLRREGHRHRRVHAANAGAACALCATLARVIACAEFATKHWCESLRIIANASLGTETGAAIRGLGDSPGWGGQPRVLHKILRASSTFLPEEVLDNMWATSVLKDPASLAPIKRRCSASSDTLLCLVCEREIEMEDG